MVPPPKKRQPSTSSTVSEDNPAPVVKPKKRLTEAERLLSMDFGPKEGGKLEDLVVVFANVRKCRSVTPAPTRRVIPRPGAEKKKADVDDKEIKQEEEEDEDKNVPGTSNGNGSTVEGTSKKARKSMADGNKKEPPPTKQSTPRQAKMFDITPSAPKLQAGSEKDPIVVPDETPEKVKPHNLQVPSSPPPAPRRSNPQPAVMKIPPFQAAPPPHNNSPHNSPSIPVQQAIRAKQGIPPPRPPQYPVAQAPRHSIAPIPQSGHQQQLILASQQFSQRQHVVQQQYQQQQLQRQQQLQNQLQQQQLQRRVHEQEEHMRLEQQQLEQQRLEQQRVERQRLDQRRRAQQPQRRRNPPRPTHNGNAPHLAPVIPIPEPVRPAEPELREDPYSKNRLLVIPPTCDYDYYCWKSADLSAWMKSVLSLDDTDPLLQKMIDEDMDGLVMEEFLRDESVCLTTLGVNTGRSIKIKGAVIKVVNNRERVRYEIEMAEYNRQMRLYEMQQREIIRN